MGFSRQNVSSGSPIEGLIGFSRVVRAGNYVAVSGTAPVGLDGNVVAPGDAYNQSKRCLEIIRQSLNQLGVGLEDVIRTRVYMINMDDLEKVAQSHSEVFGDTMPASTFLRVSGFIDPQWLVQIEVDAVIDGD
jgi:enamine deaminase RidA (YjgF/YER057c/UK114 family)